jgi:hypothetical protein
MVANTITPDLADYHAQLKTVLNLGFAIGTAANLSLQQTCNNNRD